MGQLQKHLQLSASLPSLPEVPEASSADDYDDDADDDEDDEDDEIDKGAEPVRVGAMTARNSTVDVRAEQMSKSNSTTRCTTSSSSSSSSKPDRTPVVVPQREDTPTPRTKLRLFSLFSPIFMRIGHKKRHQPPTPPPPPPPPPATAATSTTTAGTTETKAEGEQAVSEQAGMAEPQTLTAMTTTPAPPTPTPTPTLTPIPTPTSTPTPTPTASGSKLGVSSSRGEHGASCSCSSRDDTSVCSELEVLEESLELDGGEEDEEEASFDPYFFMGRLAKFVSAVPEYMRTAYFVYPNNVPLLGSKPPTAPRHTLVLDLDETLVHCSIEPVASPDFIFPVSYDGSEFRVHAYKRPYLRWFLKRVAAMFEVVLFTASLPQYAEGLMNVMDPRREIFAHCLYRSSCLQGFNSFIKDLSLLGRDLATTVIVDNSPQAFSFQPDNGIPIRSYFDAKDDCELRKLLPFLQRLAQADDVRPLLRQRYKVSEKIERAMAMGSKQP